MAHSKNVDKKSIEKKAKKALARAEKSVEKAGKAVRTSSRKLRDRAAALVKKTEKLEAKQAEAGREFDSASKAATAAKPTPVAEVLTPPLPAPEPAAPTLVELRRRAKERGVAGYSRLNKAALIAALDAADSE